MVLKKVFQTASNLTESTIHAATDVVSSTVEKAGLKSAATFIRETGDMTSEAAKTGIQLTSHVVDGTTKAVQGTLQKDAESRQEGVDDLTKTGKSIVTSVNAMVKHGATNTYEAVAGVVGRDQQRVKGAAKSLLQTPIIGSRALKLSDVIEADAANVDTIQSINELYEGTVHPVTGVAFERTELLVGDETISDVFPVFEAAFTARIEPEAYLLTDEEHHALANEQLYNAIEQDAAIGEIIGLTDEDKAALKNGQTPAGYTWHHHEQPGVLQLVNAQIHAQTEHIGGRVIWGGGLQNQY